MKLAWLWLVVATGCSVTHRSNEFACERTADCAFGRICTDGLCVSVLPVDAGPRDAGSVCPAACTSCNVDTRSCRIDCDEPGSCTQAITCPAGWSCEVTCSADNSCRNGLDCSDALDCKVTCSGAASCRTVQCGTGRCDVECIGKDACRSVDCIDACACDVRCGDAALCADLTCKDLRCFPDTIDNGCSSLPRLCDTCN